MGRGLVVTNAHVVAGVSKPFVTDPAGRLAADAVLFDPKLDIAVLRVPGLNDAPLSLLPGSSPVRAGSTAAVLGYPEGGPFTYVPAGVAAAFPATGLDIYGTATAQREIYEIDAQVLPGNSGGPLVASGDQAHGIPDGTVIGVVLHAPPLIPTSGTRWPCLQWRRTYPLPGPGPRPSARARARTVEAQSRLARGSRWGRCGELHRGLVPWSRRHPGSEGRTRVGS